MHHRHVLRQIIVECLEAFLRAAHESSPSNMVRQILSELDMIACLQHTLAVLVQGHRLHPCISLHAIQVPYGSSPSHIDFWSQAVSMNPKQLSFPAQGPHAFRCE